MPVRLGIAEIGEHTVAHLLGDEAADALNHFRAAAVIGSNDASQVLGSSLADSVVEPTKSQNMTVSWRRSAEAAVTSGAAIAAIAFTTGLATEPILAMELRVRSR
jgi:hypothetical protein